MFWSILEIPAIALQVGIFMKSYKPLSLLFMIVFVIVGMVFLFIPNQVLIFFNNISRYLGMEQSPVQGVNFYLILAIGYMYLVSLLAYLMYRHPENIYFPLLLANGKLASSILSLCLFIVHKPYLIYIFNCIVDGLIGIMVWILYFKLKREHV